MPMKFFRPSALIITVCFLFSFMGGHNDNSLTIAGLKGNVKSLKRAFYKALGKPGAVTKGNIKGSDSTTYDKNGNMVEYFYYYPDAISNYRTLSKYDDKGNEIEQDRF